MKRTFNIAIAGCGKVAHLHALAISKTEGASLVAAWSRTPASADAFARKYGLKAYTGNRTPGSGKKIDAEIGVNPCSEIGRMVNEASVDLVIVCTPHPFHRDPVLAAAAAGANILVEKPLASSLEDCDAMIAACRKNNVQLGVVSQRRWYAPVQRVKEAIDKGRIGSPVLATINMLGWRDKTYYDADAWRGTWEMEGGGVLVNQAPHQLDILQWYMGEIDEVYGVQRNLNHSYIEVEDTALAIVKFRSGAIGNIIVSNSQKPGIYGKVHVHGSNGASVGVQTDGGAMFVAGMSGITEPPVNDLWTVPGEEQMLQEWVKKDSDFFSSIDATTYYLGLQIEDFINALSESRSPSLTGKEGRKTVELFTAIYRSSRDNRPVRFPLETNEGNGDFDGRLA